MSIFPLKITALSMSLASDGYHQPNERFRWSQAEKGIMMVAAYFRNLSLAAQ
ncbi:hypothetical protein HYU19_00635 [Candidatus Woesearchaeota archaeon]|nr:hypothetical protein [Candidatus Woesearchaeota archaeon]